MPEHEDGTVAPQSTNAPCFSEPQQADSTQPPSWRQQKVRKRREFQAIQSSGRRISLNHFVILVSARGPVSPSTEQPSSAPSQDGRAVVSTSSLIGPRLGVTASRKVGNAVVRNRAKRLVREAFRACRKDLFDADVDIVVIVRRSLGEQKLADVVAEWRQAGKMIRRRVQESRADLEKRATPLADSHGAKQTRPNRARHPS